MTKKTLLMIILGVYSVVAIVAISFVATYLPLHLFTLPSWVIAAISPSLLTGPIVGAWMVGKLINRLPSWK